MTLPELLVCGLTAALTNLTPAPRQWWQRRWWLLAYASLIVAVATGAVTMVGIPWPVAALVAVVLLIASLSVGFAIPAMIHRPHIGIWWSRRGGAVALCVVQWSTRRQRHELHTWAAFPRGRGLGKPVAQAAIAAAAPPVWLHPATNSLRALYRTWGFLDEPGGWMVRR